MPQQLNYGDDNCSIIKTAGNNTTVLYPDNFLDWDGASAHLSKQLQAPVFSFHIHDGDLWMYILYVNGEAVDQFNPIPEYWDELPEEEINNWKGNAEVVAKIIPGLDKATIANYLVKWNVGDEASGKAYDTDEFGHEEWQLVDFMKKLKLPFPLKDDGCANGDTYAFTIKKALAKPVVNNNQTFSNTKPARIRPWWKFW